MLCQCLRYYALLGRSHCDMASTIVGQRETLFALFAFVSSRVTVCYFVPESGCECFGNFWEWIDNFLSGLTIVSSGY